MSDNELMKEIADLVELVDECTHVRDNAQVTAKAPYSAYRKWAGDSGTGFRPAIVYGEFMPRLWFRMAPKNLPAMKTHRRQSTHHWRN